MAITKVRTGALAASGSPAAVPWPATVDAGHTGLLFASVKPSARTFNSIGGAWPGWVSKTGGAGSNGADTGPTRVGFTYLPSTAGTEGGTTQAVSTSSTASPFMGVLLEMAGVDTTAVATASGDDATTGTGAGAYSATATSDPGYTVGDWVVVATSHPTDAGGPSSAAITVPGCTLGAVTTVPFTTNFSNDGALHIFHAEVTAGTSTGAPTLSFTPGTANEGAGPALFVRLRPAATEVTVDLDATMPALTAHVTADLPLDAPNTHFEGSSLPAGWSTDDPLGGATITVADSRVTIAVDTTDRDSIFSTGTSDDSAGVEVAVPDHGGDIDVGFQLDTDISDQRGHGINLLFSDGAGGDVRVCLFGDASTDEEYPQIFIYSRAAGVGAVVVNEDFSKRMTGIPQFIRVQYASGTGVWKLLTSVDGVTWVSDRSRSTSTGDTTWTRSFTPTTVKIGLTNVGAVSAAEVKIDRFFDFLSGIGPDVREAVPEREVGATSSLLGTDGAFSGDWEDASTGGGAVTWPGSVIRLTDVLANDNLSALVRAGIKYTGTLYDEWGLLVKVAASTADSDAYLELAAAKDDGWLDQYSLGGGYGLEVNIGPIRRPIRVDSNTDATNAPTAPFASDLNETPYCHLADFPAAYDMSGLGARWFRLERVGHRYRVKEWADGDTEPDAWNLFDGHDRTNEFPMGPAISLSHNGARTGTSVVDVHSVEFYELAAPATSSSGAGAGSWAFTGSASGATEHDGTAAGSWAFTGAGTGTSTRQGTAAGAWAFTGAAAGAVDAAGTGAGAWTFTGAGSGIAPSVDDAAGAGAGAWSFTGEAAGAQSPSGTGSGFWAFTGTGPGGTTKAGTGTGSWAYVGAATGTATGPSDFRDITLSATGPVQATTWAGTGPVGSSHQSAGPVGNPLTATGPRS